MAKKSTTTPPKKSPQSEKKAVPISAVKLREFASNLNGIADTLNEYATYMERIGVDEVKDFVKGMTNGIAMSENWVSTFSAALSKAARERGAKIKLVISPPDESGAA